MADETRPIAAAVFESMIKNAIRRKLPEHSTPPISLSVSVEFGNPFIDVGRLKNVANSLRSRRRMNHELDEGHLVNIHHRIGLSNFMVKMGLNSGNENSGQRNLTWK